jgi:anti-sigma B factor antagonist
VASNDGQSDGLGDCQKAFEVAVLRAEARWVVVFRGDLDMTATDELWRGIEAVRTSGQPVILDLAETKFMDSAGIKLLLRAYVAHGRVREGVTLRAPSDAVLHTLEVAGIQHVFNIEPRRTAPTAPA